jgi:hypothetical protein
MPKRDNRDQGVGCFPIEMIAHLRARRAVDLISAVAENRESGCRHRPASEWMIHRARGPVTAGLIAAFASAAMQKQADDFKSEPGVEQSANDASGANCNSVQIAAVMLGIIDSADHAPE